jgi:hypothetical protein
VRQKLYTSTRSHLLTTWLSPINGGSSSDGDGLGDRNSRLGARRRSSRLLRRGERLGAGTSALLRRGTSSLGGSAGLRDGGGSAGFSDNTSTLLVHRQLDGASAELEGIAGTLHGALHRAKLVSRESVATEALLAIFESGVGVAFARAVVDTHGDRHGVGGIAVGEDTGVEIITEFC